MAKRHQDTQLTKDAYEAEDERLAGGGPDSTVIPAVPADPEVMSRRTIKQPKSRFSVAGTTTPRPSFAFGSNPVSSTPETPAPTANGSSVGLFGATPATPAPKTPFAGFPTLNGGTPATPAQQSPTRSANPFASLSSTTPAGKPPTGLFGSTTPAGLFGSTTPAGMPVTPAGQPLSGGSSTTFPVPEEKKDQAKDTATPKQIFGGVSDFNFPTPAAKKDEAGGAAKPKPIFGGVSPFKFSGPAAEKDSDADKPKPMFAGASPFNIPEPAAKKDSDAGKPQPTFGGVSAPNIFGGQDEAEKKLEEEKPANPFTGMFGSKATATPAATPTKPPATTSTPVPVGGGLFGNVASTASAGLFGSDAKIGDTKKADAGLFGSKSSGSPAPATGLSGSKPEEPSKTTSGGLFGAKAPISLNASSNTGDVNYPALPSASSTTTTSVMTNGSIVGNAGASIQFNAQVPAPQEDLTEVQREEFDRQYKLRTLNATFVQALQQAEVETADLRIAFREYEKLYEQIMQGTKRKEESQPNGTAFSPKRSKTDEAKPAASSAASLFGAIVDKNVGQPTASTTNESQPKPVFGGFKPQLNNTSTPEKPAVASSFFGNTFATPAPVTTKTSSTTPTPPKTTSTLFGAGGGAAVSAPAPVGGGLFSNLKPIISDQKDKGEEDSPQKPKSAGLLFGAKPAESSTAPPPFAFKAGNTATSENSSSGGLFGSPKPSGDQTWKPDTPIKFGGSSSGLFGSQSSTSSAPSQLFNFSSQSTAASTAPSEAPKAPFSFTGNTSLGPPQSLSRTASFDSSGISTPGAISDTSASASTSAGASTSNEPSDEVRADKVDMSGPGPGEENDEVLYSVRVAVYIKDDKNAMKKVAVGASRVLKDKASGKTRFLVRTEQGKVALNVRLQKEVDYKPFPDKHVILIPDFSGDKPKMYTVRAKEGSAVAELGKIIAEVKG